MTNKTQTQTTALVYTDGVIDICRNEMIETTLEPTRSFSGLREIGLDEITAIDLASEVSAYDPDNIATADDIAAYAFVHAGGQRGDAVLFRSDGRIGISTGANADWIDRLAGSDSDETAVGRAIMSLSAGDDAAEALLAEHGWAVTRWHREVVSTAAGYARVVDIEPTEGRIPVLVSVTEIAQRLSRSVGAIHQVRRRHADFPAPIASLATGPVWAWSDVERWAAVPRRSGRPRKER